jgi:hypothetical protein
MAYCSNHISIRKFTKQGYKGKIRKLVPSSSVAEGLADLTLSERVRKRQWYGTKKLVSDDVGHGIPIQSFHHFHDHNDIQFNAYNVPDRKIFAAVDSVALSNGEMHLITSEGHHPIKALQFRPLKKSFEPYLDAGGRIKLIFVVSPDRFEKFSYQKYISTGENERGVARNKEHRQEYESENDETNTDTLDEDLIKEVNEWVDQYVMEVSVNSLIKSFDRRVEAKQKTFKEEWKNLALTSKI